jgi:hypothetical protein
MSNNTDKPPNSSAILTIAHIIKAVMSLAAEAEVEAFYIIRSSTMSVTTLILCQIVLKCMI